MYRNSGSALTQVARIRNDVHFYLRKKNDYGDLKKSSVNKQFQGVRMQNAIIQRMKNAYQRESMNHSIILS